MDYIPKRDGDLYTYEKTFLTKLPSAAATLGIATDEITQTVSIIDAHLSAYDNVTLKKQESNATVENNVAKKAAAIAEIRRVSNYIKSNSKYTDAIGKELGIVGTEEAPEDLTAIKPTLKGKILGGSAVVSFDKQKMQGVRIYSKRGSETEFTFLAVDTASPYEDNRTKLNTALPEERQYYAYYLYDDQQVGQQSDVLKIIVP